MIDIILVSISAFLIVVFAIPSIITVAKLKGLYDKPDERKIHSNKIPRLGGLAVFIGFVLVFKGVLLVVKGFLLVVIGFKKGFY